MRRTAVLVLCFCMVLCLFGCGKKAPEYHMELDTNEKKIACEFLGEDTSKAVALTENDKSEIYSFLNGISVEYVGNDIFMTEEALGRIKTEVAVESHRFCALDAEKKLTTEHMIEIVKANNRAYIENLPVGAIGIEHPDEDFLREICELIVDTLNAMSKRLPDIDFERVYCNLGNLKIVYKKGMVDNAQVTAEMVLQTSPNMFEIANNMSGENACRNIVVHEIMHIIQMGCACEEIPNCTRRCGFSFYWDDFALNTSDFGWFSEGSAERSMCNLTGDEPYTYKTMINYICLLNLATMLDEGVPANYAETLSFYADSQKLFELLECDTEQDEYEAVNMMIAANIINTQPQPIMSEYGEKYGVDIEDDAVVKDWINRLKPAFCLTLTKVFYKNLAECLASRKDITLNDVCYIIALFEESLDNLIRYSNEDTKKYNEQFLSEYEAIRTELFERISAASGVDVAAAFADYSMVTVASGKATANASLKWNDADKNLFYLERTDYLR